MVRPATPQMEEYKILRKSVDRLHGNQRRLEAIVSFEIGVIYVILLRQSCAFSGTAPNCELANFQNVGWAWYLPPVLSILLFTRWQEGARQIAEMVEYLRRVESTLILNRGQHEQVKDESRKDHLPAPFPVQSVIFWMVLCSGSLIVANQMRPFAEESSTRALSIMLGAACSLYIYLSTRKPDL